MAEIDWSELKATCPADAMVLVAASLDLLEVAKAVAEDRAEQVAGWLEEGSLQKVDTQLTSKWDTSQPRFNGAFISPFVLLQKLSENWKSFVL